MLSPAIFAFGAFLQARGVLPGIPELLVGHRLSVAPASLTGRDLRRASRSRSASRSGALDPRTDPAYANAITQFVNLGTTIPTLAILALAMSVLGIGAPPAIFGLVVLTLLPIVLNTVAGLRMVPAYLIEAARGMGMTPTADSVPGRIAERPVRHLRRHSGRPLPSMSARRRSPS